MCFDGTTEQAAAHGLRLRLVSIGHGIKLCAFVEDCKGESLCRVKKRVKKRLF